MDLITGISTGKSLIELSKELADLIKRASHSGEVEQQVLLYLEAVQTAVQALGLERQRILTEARGCDVRDAEQVDSLWKRTDRYLQEDNVRPQLEKAISGLRGCRDVIEKKGQGLRWRKRDKQKAVNSFLETLDTLNNLLSGLVYDFYPGYSGMGVQTLAPIYNLTTQVRQAQRQGLEIDYEAVNDELADLLLQSLRDSSHEDWIHMNGKVETLIAELRVAFSVKISPAN